RAIAVESEPDTGSQFTVYLPLLADAPYLFQKAEPAVQPTGSNHGLILVVDDESMVRRMAQAMLMNFGFEVISAADGSEALKIFDEKQNDIRCVLLDLTMPGMDGWETLKRLRRIRPNVPVILVSGDDEARVMEDDHAERPQAFLHKPYQMADLKAALSHAVEDMSHET
ncbi:MAG: response regulator, partial [Desulfatirhabdiaceae bacterium]